MPSKLEIVSPTILRVHCECGEYIHELSRGEDGEAELKSFFKQKEKESPVNTTKAKPKRKRSSFFDDEDEEGGE